MLERFTGNLDRVRGLVSLYEEVTGKSQGRPSVREGEILRAAVILLHATLEDFFRTLGSMRLASATPEVLSQIPFAGGDGRKTALMLGDLASHRGRMVEEFLSDSVEAYLDRRSYNDVNDLATALRQVGLAPDLVAPHAATLEIVMRRRHLIAHRLDRDEMRGRGRHGAGSISKALVERWINTVDTFARSVLAKL